MWRFAHLFLFLPVGSVFCCFCDGVKGDDGRVFGEEEDENDNDAEKMMGWREVCTWRDISPESSVLLSCGGT